MNLKQVPKQILGNAKNYTEEIKHECQINIGKKYNYDGCIYIKRINLEKHIELKHIDKCFKIGDLFLFCDI